MTRALAAIALAAALITAAPTNTPPPGFRWYSDKPAGVLELPTDCRYRDLGLTEPASGTTNATEIRELYLRAHLPKAKGTRWIEARFVRANGDATANTINLYPAASRSVPFTVIHFGEAGGAGGTWQARACGPGRPITLHTRYAKQHTVN